MGVGKGRPKPYGQVWREGDVIGCRVDIDNGVITFSINGEKLGDSGVCFSGRDSDGVQDGVSAAISMRIGFGAAINLGSSTGVDNGFKFPDDSYRAVGSAYNL